ncbi:hypothetical protein GCM10020367_33330 [Streptomyces sannanensis]|uniref:Uncharacterized protein n=1 Tax=Streptomyces sannanensis TaxID=285536 RepID=A0ABP6SCS8_9ACTN
MCDARWPADDAGRRASLSAATAVGRAAYGNKPVEICFKPKGSTKWSRMAQVTTTASGTFSKKFTAQQDGTWKAVHSAPDSRHPVGTSTEDYVDVY